jgi:hypothetical protein
VCWLSTIESLLFDSSSSLAAIDDQQHQVNNIHNFFRCFIFIFAGSFSRIVVFRYLRRVSRRTDGLAWRTVKFNLPSHFRFLLLVIAFLFVCLFVCFRATALTQLPLFTQSSPLLYLWLQVSITTSFSRTDLIACIIVKNFFSICFVDFQIFSIDTVGESANVVR